MQKVQPYQNNLRGACEKGREQDSSRDSSVYKDIRLQVLREVVWMKENGSSMIMNKLTKDQILIAISTLILLFTAMINWNIYSWLTLLAIIVILIAWYFKK